MKIAIATSLAQKSLPEDELFFANALRAQGVYVEPLVWTEAIPARHQFDACVVRSTWDYHLDHQAFIQWLDRLDENTLCINSRNAIRWNSDKKYLLDLSMRGVPIVPTISISKEDRTNVDELASDSGWEDFIIKPSVSASSLMTERFRVGARPESARHLKRVLEHSDAIVQPFIPDVYVGGERSYIVIGGIVTHAVRRAPFNGGAKGIEQPRVVERRADLELVNQTLAALPFPPLYARIDIVHSRRHEPMLAECELIEPSLFFSRNVDAARMLARLVVDTCQSDQRVRSAHQVC